MRTLTGQQLTEIRDRHAGAPEKPIDRTHLVRGQPYGFWKPTIGSLMDSHQDRQALQLLEEIIPVAEQHAQELGRSPDTYYTLRAADVCLRLQEHKRALALLDRWRAASPPVPEPGTGMARQHEQRSTELSHGYRCG